MFMAFRLTMTLVMQNWRQAHVLARRCAHGSFEASKRPIHLHRSDRNDRNH